MGSNTTVTVVEKALVRVECSLPVPPNSWRYLWRKIENRPGIAERQLGREASQVIHALLSVRGVDRLVVWEREVWVYPQPLQGPADIYPDVLAEVERMFQE